MGELQSIADANVQAGKGMGWRAAVFSVPPTSFVSALTASREDDVAALKKTAGELQQQLAETMARLDELQ